MPVPVSPLTDRIRHHIDEVFAQDLFAAGDAGGGGLAAGAQAGPRRPPSKPRSLVPRPRPLPAGRGQRGCPAWLPERLPGNRTLKVHRRAGHAGPAQAAPGHGNSASRLFGTTTKRPTRLNTLWIASFFRDLSVRDMEAALAEALSDQAAISKSTVPSVCPPDQRRYPAWSQRRLDGITLDYLFLDASFFRMHPAPRPSGCWPPGQPPPAASPRSSAWPPAPASRRRLACLPDHLKTAPGFPAADHLRRRPRPDRRDRAGLPEGTASALSHPPVPEHPGQIPAGMLPEVKDAYRSLRHRDLKPATRPEAGGLIDARISEMAAKPRQPVVPAEVVVVEERPGDAQPNRQQRKQQRTHSAAQLRTCGNLAVEGTQGDARAQHARCRYRQQEKERVVEQHGDQNRRRRAKLRDFVTCGCPNLAVAATAIPATAPAISALSTRAARSRRPKDARCISASAAVDS